MNTWIFTGVFLFLGIFYFFKIGRYALGLRRLPHGTATSHPTFEVLIPARNEEENIEACLRSVLNQTYPAELFHVTVIDDHSADRTAEIVQHVARAWPGRLTLLPFTDAQPHQAYKKAAIQFGIDHTQSDLIATIDADCTAQPTWLESLARHFEPDVGMVSGYILMNPHSEKTLFQKIQSLEFLGLVTTGAGAIGIGEPVISNGANLSYRRKVFEEVDGFRDIDHLPSGDDDLLMQKIHRLTPWKVRFAFEKSAHNFTHPVATLRQFLNQRTRWASKSAHYHSVSLVFFLVSVYFFYLFLFLFPLWILLGVPPGWIGLGFLLKWLPDFAIVAKGARFTGRKDLLPYFLLAQFFQIPYILWVGAKGLRGNYEWKGRNSR